MVLEILAAAVVATTPVKPEPVWVMPLVRPGTSKEISCTTAFQNVADGTVQSWVTGFWSGLNFGEGRMVGQASDADGIIAEVKLECSKSPSDPLTSSVVRAYRRLQKNGR